MSDKLNVVLYWHMHQPEYRDLRSGEYRLPWTYLHAIKDYVDMAAHLEANPDARAVVNFAPILIEQIDDYARQLDDYLKFGGIIRDPLLSALVNPVMPADMPTRLKLLQSCLRANEHRLIERFPVFLKLANMAKAIIQDAESLHYYSDQYLADILMWYHLAWMGETVRREDARIKQLLDKKCLFNMQDRRLLLSVIHELVSGVLARYKKLAETGRIELSMTPYAHPIVPLLLDIESAKQAMPDVSLPENTIYPDGKRRCSWHIEKGLETFKRHFGCVPQGCWPSEGSISADTIKLLGEHGIRWLASGETVLRNSLHQSQPAGDHCIHRAYQYDGAKPFCFFRDDGLSDLIGFRYADWHADDAVANLVHNLENIFTACHERPGTIVSIILDGENAWEYYFENGFYFLKALYEKLSTHPRMRLTTYSEYLAQHAEPVKLTDIVAGSWVYGTFSTWIGDKDKNRAWDMLIEAKREYDRVMASHKLPDTVRQRAEMQLAICEGSDWFWWFGDYNPAESVAAFDEQFRLHLCNLYHLLGVTPPDYLSQAFSHGSHDSKAVGTMLPGRQQ
jgi:alpha-amylase/alpha-mannosidase (GH57 family)